MENKTQQTTKYPGVYVDSKGNFFYQSEFGTDRFTGKRIRKKGRKDATGKPFSSAFEANKELTRLKREYHKVNSYAHYKLTYSEFMNNVYIPAYRTEVEESTFTVRKRILEKIRDRFGSLTLRAISVEDVQNFRTWLLMSKEKGGAGFSQSYASLIFGSFRQSLDMAVEMQYLEDNISKKVKAIPKSKAIVPYWTKQEFEKVISQIYIEDFYENLSFVILWIYFYTGLRVNEATALWWEDVDLIKKRMRVHHMLIIKSRNDWKRNSYTKTEGGKRIIALDDDTVKILAAWRDRQKEIGLGKENDFIFSYDGLPMIKSTIARIIARYAKLAGVKKIQAKGLRHSHASYLINEFNVSVLVLSKRMGHSSPEITLKHYAHLWNGADSVIADEMSGNVKIETAKETKIHFNGNKSLKKRR
ncbi:tyrosine-type recombinase/integrase [Sporolactobacillus terrae]|uniref:Site-specific integrase n=1 Tax=Sporolactobacillus terrae TaxID=269673 RepID=A0ABX5QA72_9BACL|nr:site-specific integrase [Sporolactobacillus terrae]QAA23528.1 site-specific integrase [Sporolactobacillus terrae]QAA26498.1 site-specific integrase [Sporolactobacillus terrae]